MWLRKTQLVSVTLVLGSETDNPEPEPAQLRLKVQSVKMPVLPSRTKLFNAVSP